jgi:Icc-related predicted phosphoesterase
MSLCFFVSDLHGHLDRYQKLYMTIRNEQPDAVFLGGDILPSFFQTVSAPNHEYSEFIKDHLEKNLIQLREELGTAYPRVFLILGNDDGRTAESSILDAAGRGVWEYVHNRRAIFQNYSVFGYSFIPPSPFLLKDWEKYDVSRYVDPGAISPEEGVRSYQLDEYSQKYSTIKKDLDQLAGDANLEKAIFLFHSPPYKTKLDRAALDGKMIDHVPLDVHVGSIAIRQFIESHQPMLTLHGHVHESAFISKAWKDRLGATYLFSAAHDGPELAMVRFDPEDLDRATRELL